MNELQTIHNQNEIQQTQNVNTELLHRFLNYIDASEKTVQTYTRALKQFFKYLYEHNITKPTRSDVLAFRDYLRDEGI